MSLGAAIFDIFSDIVDQKNVELAHQLSVCFHLSLNPSRKYLERAMNFEPKADSFTKLYEERQSYSVYLTSQNLLTIIRYLGDISKINRAMISLILLESGTDLH